MLHLPSTALFSLTTPPCTRWRGGTPGCCLPPGWEGRWAVLLAVANVPHIQSKMCHFYDNIFPHNFSCSEDPTFHISLCGHICPKHTMIVPVILSIPEAKRSLGPGLNTYSMVTSCPPGGSVPDHSEGRPGLWSVFHRVAPRPGYVLWSFLLQVTFSPYTLQKL